MSVLIDNATVIDGLGGAAFRGAVLLSGDRIAEVFTGAAPRGTDADTVVDAAGSVVSPGFIDSHAHSDAYLVLEPDAPSKISQGITTEVNGQCGGSAAPRYGEARLSSDWASLLGDRLVWRSFAEYRKTVEEGGIALNTVQFVGHNTLRSSVVGYAGRPSTPDELREMERILEESLEAGGWGLTTGLIYQPGRYAAPEEVLALASVTAAKGGLYATHMRSEGDSILEAIDETADLARKSGVRVEISHLKTSGKANWGKLDDVICKIEDAIAEGLFLGSDRYPYCAAGTDLDIVLPDWAQEGAAKAEMARLADPALRARIVSEINGSGRDWSAVMIGGTWHEKTRRYSGMRVSDMLSAGEYPSPGELVADVLSLDLCRTGAFFFSMSEENLDKILSLPWIVPGSDASLRSPHGPLGLDHPHPRAYSTMPEFVIRLRALGFPLEEIVMRMTSVPAARFGIKSRGVLERGAAADVIVWRPESFRSNSTYAQPHAFASGMEKVFVNGALTYDSGRFTGSRAGRFLSRSP